MLHLSCGIFPLNSRIKWPLCHVHVHFDCACSHKRVPNFGGTAFFLYINFGKKWLLGDVDCASTARACTKWLPRLGARHFSLKSLHKMAFVRCSCVFRLCRLAQNGCPALGPFYHDLARVSCCTLGGPSDL